MVAQSKQVIEKPRKAGALGKTLAEDALDIGNTRVERALTLYKEYLGETSIEKTKEESFVLEQLLLGTSGLNIRRKLKEKHPEFTFSGEDFEKFLVRNDEAVKYLSNRNTSKARRHIQARLQIEEHLASLLLFSEQLAIEAREKGELGNSIGAVRAALDGVGKIAKVMGYETEGEAKTQNIINIFSDKHSKLRDRVHAANFVIDAEFEEVIDDDG